MNAPPSANNLRLALFQMRVCMDKQSNLQKCCEWLAIAAREGADVVLLPELFTMPLDPVPLLEAAEPFEGETAHRVRAAAARHGLVVVAGSFAEAAPQPAGGRRIYNTSFAVGKDGALLAKYRKCHLFDPAYDGVGIKESDCMLPGNAPAFFDCLGHPAAIAICYDLRFPAFFSRLAARSRIVFAPAAFNRVSGPAHWELLVRARALDGQIFVAACSPAPNPDLRYNPYGHSLVADPWGCVLLDAGENEGIFYAEMNLDRVREVRAQLPLALQSRPELYGV